LLTCLILGAVGTSVNNPRSSPTSRTAIFDHWRTVAALVSP
jgi:hypothetical protein